MGSGKNRVMNYLQRNGYLPLREMVHLDSDLVKLGMPEWGE